MCSVFDVAQYILTQTGSISTWKLQKLCYYSQAWSLAWTENPLFEEDFEAWTNGPVCPVLYNAHRGRYMIGPDALGKGSVDALDPDQKDTIDRVLTYYGTWDPYALREQTHSEGPWLLARNGIPDDMPSNAVISKESMGEFYGGL